MFLVRDISEISKTYVPFQCNLEYDQMLMITKEKIEALIDPGSICFFIILAGDPAALKNLWTGDCGGSLSLIESPTFSFGSGSSS